MQDTQLHLPEGSVVQHRYLVEDLLGKGGFGAVYLVKDQRVQNNVFALKEVIEPDKQDLERFMFEGDVLKRLDHPALPRVYRVIEDEKRHRAYILMDYIEGPNLEILRHRQPGKRFSLAQIVHILEPIIEAVSYLHTQRPPIIHRDIKPANIIVPITGRGAVLVDFGIAKEYEEDSTTTAVRHCSPGYAAPEQYTRGTNPRTDIYSLAATCYALLSGTVPADSLFRMTHLGSGDSDPLLPLNELEPQVPAGVARAIQRALSINSNERFATVEEFWQEISSYADKKPAPIHDLADTSERNEQILSATTASPIEDTPTVDPSSVRERSLKAPHRLKRRNAFGLIGLICALIALVLGIVFARQFPLKAVNQTEPGTKTTATQTVATGTRATATPTSKPSPTVATTPSVSATQPTSKPAPSRPPSLLGFYTGTIHNDYSTPVDTSMTLSNISQKGAEIKGDFTVGEGLQGNGPFTGTIDPDGSLRFRVPGIYGHLPLLFTGKLYPNEKLSGEYCSYRDNDQCDFTSGGYGKWSVAPPSPQSFAYNSSQGGSPSTTTASSSALNTDSSGGNTPASNGNGNSGGNGNGNGNGNGGGNGNGNGGGNGNGNGNGGGNGNGKGHKK